MMPKRRLPNRINPDRFWVGLIFLLLFIVVIRTSWISDDAFITFRSVENFVNGYGLTYNVGERVQTYTHPLWVLILSVSYFISFRVLHLDIPAALPFISLIWSWIFLLFSIAMLGHIEKEKTLAYGLGIWILVASKAFIDFSASGLENPLTYAFLGLFFTLYSRVITSKTGVSSKHILYLSLTAGFATLNRMDSGLIFLPSLALAWYYTQRRKKALLLILTGFSPLILWELFSIIYYGFLFPNTAYAKLNSGIASWAYIKQGFWYLASSLTLDPITLLIILVAGLFGVMVWDRKITPASIGIFLYLGYILRIGGDYMSGRFLSSLVFLAVIILLNADIQWNKIALPAVGCIFILGILTNSLPYASDSSFENQGIDQNAIADERGFRYQEWGFLRISRNKLLPDSPFAGGHWSFEGIREVRVSGAIGLEGYRLGPNEYILDIMALADPLLARLPARDKQHWRVGHIERVIPVGYIETLAYGQNTIEDPDLSTYYDYLTLVTRGPIWSRKRLKAILHFQLGHYDHYLDAWEG